MKTKESNQNKKKEMKKHPISTFIKVNYLKFEQPLYKFFPPVYLKGTNSSQTIDASSF